MSDENGQEPPVSEHPAEESSQEAPRGLPTPTEKPEAEKRSTSLELGAQLYEWRNQTPLALAFLVLAFAAPTARSATIGTLLVVCGELLRLYCASFLGEGSLSRSPVPTAHSLEKHGPYALVRHPLYAGNFIILNGFAAYSGVLWLTVLSLVAFAFQYYWIAQYEDSVLEETFGEDFAAYQRSVPAWIPARPVTLSELEWAPSWTPALETEKRTLLALLLMFIGLLFCG